MLLKKVKFLKRQSTDRHRLKEKKISHIKMENTQRVWIMYFIGVGGPSVYVLLSLINQ